MVYLSVYVNITRSNINIITSQKMVRTIALGLLVVGITPMTLAKSVQSASLSNRVEFSDKQSQAVAFQTYCDKSVLPCTTTFRKFKLNSDSWLREIAASILPNTLFLTCDNNISSAKRLAIASNETANNSWQKSSSSSFLARQQSGISLSYLGTTINPQCGSDGQQRLHSSAKIDLRSTLASQNSISQVDVRPQFPKLLRSSLVVSFPQENSTFVPKSNKLANPAPETKRIASPFGWRRRPYSNQLQFHQGIDYGAPYGSGVVAVGNGIVTRVVRGCADFGNLFCGGQLGNWVEIDHGNGIIGTYGHLKYSSIVVTEGARVRKNQPIAQVGSSGWSTGAHLDFRLKINGKHENPAEHVMAIDETDRDKAVFGKVN